jgi:hypothetical protein
MQKINFTILSLVLFSLAISSPVTAGNMNQTGGEATLTSGEEAGLLFMREEEKLARDVYLALFDEWGLRVFDNIADSEQQHMEAVLGLILKYGLDDPALGPGEFLNPDLQGLYYQLLAKGRLSIVDAIEVGVIIEETDIEDIDALLQETTKNDIKRVYSNLLDGSYNHLAAFNSHLPAE